MEQARARTLTNTSTEFEVLCGALASFVDGEGGGLPPLTGSIPDMHSDNPKYIALQKVYIAKAAQDLAVMQGRVVELSESVGLPKDFVSSEKVELFCRQAWSIKVWLGGSSGVAVGKVWGCVGEITSDLFKTVNPILNSTAIHVSKKISKKSPN